ncbi:phytanoyl-CoA dioxygenase family protein [Paenibacillus cymbidii]|uniref:phytanoyl-CoA dioxygenase family protein n=1 Tax=Paenibacillus cymbidii TaxID=1639034 RepID=UPI0014366DB1|nr:phytanoyl-CoA dioxygenase family protein [Paenibacillus cymbidii]
MANGLSEAQVQQFYRDGYLVYGDFLAPQEVEELREAYMLALDNMRAANQLKTVRPGDKEVFQIRVAHLHHPRFDGLLRNERLLDLVESLIGPNLRLVLYQGLYKPPFKGGVMDWHQDDFYFRVHKENAVASCWVALDDVTVDNGCMWVVPGAHGELLEHVKSGDLGWDIPAIDESRAIPLEMKSGQIMFHHGLAPHRTLENTTPSHRRALALHFMDAMASTADPTRKKEPLEHVPVLRGTSVPW